ncbi:MAG: DUF3857 domain-containing protein [Acidobacteria bacterium]|nr:DUF3857 domain-containing protein [Acidobacteriota bacterium]
MFAYRLLIKLAYSIVGVLLLSGLAWAGDDWRPVEPAQLAMKTPVVEKDADAEAIFWEVRVNDSDFDLIFNHYVRIKIFTERGRETQSKIDIPYFGKYHIKDIAGRTIKPDGTIVELKKDAVFERTIVKLSGLKVQAKSFAMPAVEPGAIIEYRWKEVRPQSMADNLQLQFQRDIPVQLVKYYLKPASADLVGDRGMNTMTFHGQNTALVKDKDGFYSMTMTNMPAFREEPLMPPEDQVRTWMLIYYTREAKPVPEKFWGDLGKRYYDIIKDRMKANDEVKKAAATIIGDATTPEEKLKRLFDYCRYKIKNVNDDAAGMTDEQRKKLKENHSPADTLKRGMGNSADIDLLFAALASAAGFEARLALSSYRDSFFFDPGLPLSYFMRPSSIAVHLGDNWKFFNPGTTLIPFGMLRWQEEGVPALVADAKASKFVDTPMAAPDKSLEKREAHLHLSEDGTLEGEVKIVYTGHLGYEKKEYNDDDSPQQREANLREMFQKRMSTAELSNIRIENVTDPDKPFTYAFHLKVPGYAQRTGKRLFLQPGFFQHGIASLFQTSERKYAVYFHYPWMEEDQVLIDLPTGYALDHADRPAPFVIEKVGKHEIYIGISKDGQTLEFKRHFFFGGQDRILFPAASYPTLKQIFDTIHEADNHTLTLKQAAVN